MKRFFILILFLHISLLGTFAQTIYASSSLGDDRNDGLTQDRAIRDIRVALTKGDRILLKAEDSFFCAGIDIVNKTLSRWGEGNNPNIFGFRKPGTDCKWSFVEANIWKMDLYDSSFTGVPNEKSDVYCNNIGCIYEYDKDLIHGNKVQYYKDLKNNWDIWQTENFDKDTKPIEFRYVFLYLDRDPNELSLEFTTGTHAAIVKDAIIDGVNFIGFGFGIQGWSNTTIKNCKIDIIGGRTFIGYSIFCNYGNGIEFYVAHDIENCLVENCFISRCYDCGATIQASNAGRAKPKNIVFRNNLLMNNCQGWEDFLRNDPDIIFDNCRFENNIVLFSGESGFGYSDGRLKYCHILGNNINGPRHMIIKDNIFIGGNFYCSGGYNGEYKSNHWEGNICYLGNGDFLFHDYWATSNALGFRGTGKRKERNAIIDKYRSLTGDQTTRFYINSPKSLLKKANKKKNVFLKNKQY